MQSFPSVISDPDLDDMGTKELSALVEKLTGRVTAIERKLDGKRPESIDARGDRTATIALTVSVLALIAVPVGFLAWLEPHLHADLKNDVTIEVTNQLKDPLKQIGDIAGDVKEIKGKLEVLDPLIRQLTIKGIGEAASLTSKELVARLPELKQLAKTAKSENVALKPEAVQKVGTKLIEVGDHSPDAWQTALSFVDYKSFLNPSLPFNRPIPIGPDVNLTTHYDVVHPAGLPPAKMGVWGIAPKDQAAKYGLIGTDKNQQEAIGNAFIFMDGNWATLDGMGLKHVIFRNVHIVYQGGSLELDDVYFLNCTFDGLPIGGNTQRLVSAILSPSPETNFKSS